MKNTQNYLIFKLALSIIFCVSLNIFAMEPIGEAGTSSEAGAEGLEVSTQHKHMLAKMNDILHEIFQDLIKQKENPHLNPQQHDYIKKLQKNIRETIEIIQEMYFGVIPVDIRAINQKVESIKQAIPFFY